MQRVVHLLVTLCVVLGLTGIEASAAAQADDVLDMATVPLTVQELPEAGYQVLTGGYLSPLDAADLVAGPRNLDVESVLQWFDEVGLSRTYTLDLVLPEDRGWQDSPFLAVVQTNVFLVEDEASADELMALMQNYANTAFVTEISPAVSDAYTISMTGEAGDQIRTLITDGHVLIEIVSMDATGAPDETEHILIVEATLDRLDQLRSSGEIGLSSMAFSLQHGDDTANFGHSQQTGVHGIYRYRDASVQPAIGELDAEGQVPAPGMTSLFVSGDVGRTGGGVSLISVWLGSFDSEGSASSFFEHVVDGSPSSLINDPFFNIADTESWTEQGVLGVYRVAGTFNGQAYSGHVEIRQTENVVIAIGYRSVGDTLPNPVVTSSIMDHQLDCLGARTVCPPFELVVETATPQASPVATESGLGSEEFGWSLPELGADWTIDEQFTDAGYDRLGLRNGLSIFELESVINHHGEPLQCVLDELHLLEEFEEHSVITVWEDENGNTEGGNTPDHAWIVYRVEPLAEERADQEYVIRIDCYSLISDSANLVVKHIAPVDFWLEERSKGDDLRNVIMLPEGLGPHGKLAAIAHDWRTAMILEHLIYNAA